MRPSLKWIAILLMFLGFEAYAVKPPLASTTVAWQLTLWFSVPDSAADGGVAYNRLMAGIEEAATNGFDRSWDVRAFLAGPVQAYFAHAGDSGYDPYSNQLWQDLQAGGLPRDWAIEVIAESGRVVTITWTMPDGEVSCATNQFSLMSTDGLGETDLCTTGSLTYWSDGQIRRFVLKVS